MRWEYTTTPRQAQRRFVCTADEAEYTELAYERGATSAWYMKPASGLEANDKEAFKLLSFSVNGKPRDIRRSERKTSQTYSVSIGAEHLHSDEPVTIAYTYRVVMNRTGSMLFFYIKQPTRDLRVEFDYTGCGIANVNALDLVPSVRPTRIERSPEGAPG